MASFAPGTSQQYIEDYYRRVGPSLGGTGPEDRGAPYGPQHAAPPTPQYGQTRGMTPSKPGPGRPSVPMQPQGMTPSKPAVPMPQYGQPGGMTPSKPGPGRPSVPMAPSYSPGQAKPQQSPYATSTPYGQQQPPAPRRPDYGKIGDWSDADIAAANESQFSGGQRPFHPVRYSRDASGNVVMTPSMLGMPPVAYRPSASPPAPSMPPSGSGSPFPVLIDGRGGQPADRPPSLYGPDPMTVSPSGHPMHILMHNPQQQPASRPPPFQATTQNFDGTTSQMPNFQQRDAFIAQINNQLGQMQNQSWQRPGMGAPQFNFPQMWGQAGEMAGQGFRNPFSAPQQQGPAGAGRLHSGFPRMAGDMAPGAVGQPMSPQMLDLLRQGAVF